ncbi:DNA repair protein RadA [Treponema pallidum]|uniref:DNA repair protein RadA n=3 Tax=Treponema TaxID=157 RepID=RADA_TREPA|nr:DNA repair protein RadA [Treponema pallidum]O83985.1 RecName: Full=DNA repair protein RadA; AltName: Full=Branch migration protein RadA [Treponema pallidum subsp. pallidum str. Nichols]AAC65973.1 DNA repair protein (sms) [Treponema pallidum subsp. pallidum str. Nichols]ACD71438.1 DNA repair protein [Treponema pallidum subsp. pallidum SS14]ADD73115.1 DNA repair protein RadA [Treponema pallidum subsp. pallidum str. Chicago]AEZ61361.1 DNA repair protein Sms [Treponema pallidum subsp. pallidum 
MAKKTERAFSCVGCGYVHPKWLGRCPECGEWNSFEETPSLSSGDVRAVKKASSSPVQAFPLCAVRAQDAQRISCGIAEFDRVLGGGAVRRSAIMIGGEPGIGKSTLLLQIAAACGKSVLYVSGEESPGQIRGRADRLNIPIQNIELLCATRVEDVERVLNTRCPTFVIVDSIQTVFSPEAGAIPMTINQLKYCANELIAWVKERDSVLFFTAHVTKDGNIAGPKVVEHMVDTVISFERNEEDIRFLRALKNRFGSVDELGIFTMGENGLSAVQDTAGFFISTRQGMFPVGSATVPVCEGSRVFMVEIQALTVPAKSSVTRVFSDRIDSARVSRVAAVIEKRVGLKFSDQDIYVNVAGGIRLYEPAVDVALAMALYSARQNTPVKTNAAFIGEVSLSGEIRPVRRLKTRLKTAYGLGFSTIYVPIGVEHDTPPPYTLRVVGTLAQTIAEIFSKAKA